VNCKREGEQKQLFLTEFFIEIINTIRRNTKIVHRKIPKQNWSRTNVFDVICPCLNLKSIECDELVKLSTESLKYMHMKLLAYCGKDK
jgi:hypothetical protein